MMVLTHRCTYSDCTQITGHAGPHNGAADRLLRREHSGAEHQATTAEERELWERWADLGDFVGPRRLTANDVIPRLLADLARAEEQAGFFQGRTVMLTQSAEDAEKRARSAEGQVERYRAALDRLLKEAEMLSAVAGSQWASQELGDAFRQARAVLEEAL